MKIKTQTQVQFILLMCVLLFAGFAAYSFFFHIPMATRTAFGEPFADLDDSRVLLLSARLFFNRDQMLTPTASRRAQEIFIIHPGEIGREIAIALTKEGYIQDPEIFVDYMVYRGIDRVLQAGVYLIPREITPKLLADSLVDPNPEDVAFAFPAGWRVEEIAALLPSSGLSIQPDEFIDYVKNAPIDETRFGKINGYEGFLFPGRYQILRDATLEDLVRQLTGEFTEQLPDDYEQRLKENGLSLYEGVILASIIEKEAVITEEAPIIAGVFLNRLAEGMPLQSDPTVQYALGFIEESGTWWKNPLSTNDLATLSPYNTYQTNQIPPTPICNPGMNALLSVVNAEKTAYLFFRAACDGSGRHNFSRTYQEHLDAACIK
jgi:UPF0755 protein